MARIVPQFVGGMIFGAISESFASEQAARRTAMEAASDNAEEMIGSLSLAYNRAVREPSPRRSPRSPPDSRRFGNKGNKVFHTKDRNSKRRRRFCR